MFKPDKSCLILTIACLAAGFSILAPAEPNWPRFRGPTGSGQVEEKGFPATWSAADIAWRTALPGQGQSSPCIWGDQIFLTAAEKLADVQIKRIVLAVSRSDGRILWQKEAHVGGAEKTHGMNGFASPTCATDGQHVIAFFGRGGIHCYSNDGRKMWSHDLGEFPGPWGTAASPIILDGCVIQNCDAQGTSSLVAFDVASGKEVWKTKRRDKPRGGWNTPIIIEVGDRRELIVNGESAVCGYDPVSGKELWSCSSFIGRGTPMPAYGHGMLFVINGKAGDVYVVKPGGEGDVTSTHRVWHTERRGVRDLASPILMEDILYAVATDGKLMAYDAKSGKEIWRTRLDGKYSASPLSIDGGIQFYCESGKTVIIEPGDKLEILAENDLGTRSGEIFRATPAASMGQLFFRSTRALYCVGEAK